MKKVLTFFVFFTCLILSSTAVIVQDTISPQRFGAIADGKTDCTDAIRMMLFVMKTDGIYEAKFDPGLYLISDEIIIDFPCKITGTYATIITQKTLPNRYAFKFTKSPKGDFVENNRETDISLNFKTHGVPLGLYGYNNINIHDCILSTFTSENTSYKDTGFWFAVDCNRLYNARFFNIKMDQPSNNKINQFNSADGIHLAGLCHDILIDSIYGHCGDDFIALNANENTPGDIYNITIRNCNIGSDAISKNGIRIYGARKASQLSIYNVTIENCNIHELNSPCLYITNCAAGTSTDEYNKLKLRNLTVKDCEFYAPKYEYASKEHPSIIRIAGVDGSNIKFLNITAHANEDSLSYFINIMDYNDISDLTVENCSFSGSNIKNFIKVGKSINTDTKVGSLRLINCSCKEPKISLVNNYGYIRELSIKKCKHNFNSILLKEQQSSLIYKKKFLRNLKFGKRPNVARSTN